MNLLVKQLLVLWSDLGRNIQAGSRLVVLLPVQRDLFIFTYGQALLLLLVSFCLSFGYDYYNSAPDNEFSIYGLNYQSTLYLLFFFSIFCIACLQHNFTSLLESIILLQAIVPAIWLVYTSLIYASGFQQVLDHELVSWLVFLGYLAWYLVIVFRLIRDIYQVAVPRGLILVGVYALINFGPLYFMPNQPLWSATPDSGRDSSVATELNVEDTYYAQTEMLGSAVKALLQQRPGIIDLYFLGFAGDASEDVFMNEASYARTLFDERFDTRGRSMLLVNNRKTVHLYPLANTHNLGLALHEIAGRMDTEEDILFLFMTSHGSVDHKLSAGFDLLLMNDITAEAIQSGLDSAGIKWRVIVISACYSGAFISLLEDDHALVITASGGDRNSFGCGHDGEFTYFGEAFFGKHLRQGHSFISAFRLAREEIEDREQREGKVASRPQIFIGKEMEQKLDILINRLEDTGRNNWAISRPGTGIVENTTAMEDDR